MPRHPRIGAGGIVQDKERELDASFARKIGWIPLDVAHQPDGRPRHPPNGAVVQTARQATPGRQGRGVAPGQQSHAGRRKASRNRRVPVLFGDAGQPVGQSVGQYVLRRLEAALDTLPGRIAGALATRRGRGQGVRKHTRPRTRTRPSDWWVASVTALVPRTPRANGAGRPKDFAAPADKREGRCASPDGQSAHRPPVSFARFSTALGRSADYPPTPLQRTASLVPVLLPCSARTPWDARPASKTKHGFVARTTAGKPKLLHGSSAIRSDDPRQALRRRWRSSFNGLVEPVPCARNLMCIAIRFSDGSQCPERRSMADRGTPAAPALACQSANSTADTRAVTTTVPRSGITPHKGEGAAPRRPLSEPVAPLSLATPRQLSNQHPVTRTRSATW